MKTRFVVILLVLNVAVLAAGYVYFSNYWGQQVEKDRASAQVELSSWKARAEAASARPPTIVVQTNAFNWSQLESTDYRQYIANHAERHHFDGRHAALRAAAGSILSKRKAVQILGNGRETRAQTYPDAGA
jgi:hypothetical protein